MTYFARHGAFWQVFVLLKCGRISPAFWHFLSVVISHLNVSQWCNEPMPRWQFSSGYLMPAQSTVNRHRVSTRAENVRAQIRDSVIVTQFCAPRSFLCHGGGDCVDYTLPRAYAMGMQSRILPTNTHALDCYYWDSHLS